LVVISVPRYGFSEALRPLRKPLTPIKFLYATDLVYKLLDRQSLEQKPRDSDTGSMGEVYKD
jgi:hypothetical protein